MKNEITIGEAKRLKTLEAKVQTAIDSSLDAGIALREIRDQKLYREDYDTFEEYCQKRWGFSRQRAQQLIEGVEIREKLPKNVNKCLQNESQTRALKNVPEEDRAEVVKEAAKDGKVTTSKIEEAAKKVEAKKQPKADKVIHLDRVGRAIPESILEDWNRAQSEADEMQRQLSNVKCWVDKGLENEDVIFGEIRQDTLARLKHAYSDLNLVTPHAVCPNCQGHQRKNCTNCRKRGFVSKFYWNNCIPQETKDIIAKAQK